MTKFNTMYVLLHFEVFIERGTMIFDISNLGVSEFSRGKLILKYRWFAIGRHLG